MFCFILVTTGKIAVTVNWIEEKKRKDGTDGGQSTNDNCGVKAEYERNVGEELAPPERLQQHHTRSISLLP